MEHYFLLKLSMF